MAETELPRALCQIDLTGDYGSFIGWITKIADGWLYADGRWLTRDKRGYLREQNLARPLSQVHRVTVLQTWSSK